MSERDAAVVGASQLHRYLAEAYKRGADNERDGHMPDGYEIRVAESEAWARDFVDLRLENGLIAPVDPPERVSEPFVRAGEPVPGTHLRPDGTWCQYLHDGRICNKCGFHRGERVSEASSLREALVKALGADDFSSGLDALAGTVRYHGIEDGRWSDLNVLYNHLVSLQGRVTEHVKGAQG